MENVVTKSCEQFGTVRQINGEPALWCGSDVAKALGYSNPRKALLDHCKDVTKRDAPTNSGIQKMSFIPEADVYRLICHSKLPKAQEFEQWVFEDVVPKAVKGESCRQLTFDDTAQYEYFDKTYRGVAVLTSEDISHLFGKNYIVSATIRNNLEIGTEYCLLEKAELAKFKIENPKVKRSASAILIVFKAGFEKLCKVYGAAIEKPKCFRIEEKESRPIKFITQQTRANMAEIRRQAERLIHLTYLLDDSEGQMLSGETYYQSKMAIIRQMKAIGNCVIISQRFK